jgi:DNA-directed RNA polymerase subunit RPC12/RpoP
MAKVFCKFCGQSFSSVQSLTSTSCSMHPDGVNKGKHALYEGQEKSQYICKFCGQKSSSISTLTHTSCSKHPNGVNKGKHSPAL